MATEEMLHAAQYRLAQHYLKKLSEAATASGRGYANQMYGLHMFDHEWPQIQRWKALATAQTQHANREWAQLCRDFVLQGSNIMSLRQTTEERLQWWRDGLEAASLLEDQAAELRILPNVALTYFNTGQIDEAERYGRRLLQTAEAAGDKIRMNRALFLLGLMLEERGALSEAAAYFERSLELSESLQSTKDIGYALLGLGGIAVHDGKYEEAYQHFFRYMKLTEAPGQEMDYCNALQALSEALRNLKRYDEAESYLRTCVQRCRDLNYQFALGQSLIALGVCVMDRGDLAAGKAQIEEGLVIAREFSAARDVIHGLSSLGYVRFRMGEFSAALEPLLEGLAMAREGHMPDFICYTQRNLAYAYLGTGDIDSAGNALRESLTIARTLGTAPQIVKTLSCAVTYAHRLGQHEQAAHWAGCLMGNPELDEALFGEVCHALESALGEDAYHQALKQGKSLTLDDVMREVMALMLPEIEGR